MNNLQIAIARIQSGVTCLLSAIKDNGKLTWSRRKATEERASLKVNHAECNGIVGRFGRYGEKYVSSEEENTYMTNPNLTICVPIAPGESDVEFLEEEDEETETSEDEEQKPVRTYESYQLFNNITLY